MLSMLRFFQNLNHRRLAARRRKYVPTRIYKRVESDLNAVADAVVGFSNPFLRVANIKEVVPCSDISSARDVCLFVSYSPSFLVKKHVREHILALRRNDVSVVLVVNVDNFDSCFEVDDELKSLLSGLYCRENHGYDFSAWSHLYSLLGEAMNPERLYLVNDSIVGPLDQIMFDRMMARIRESKSEMVGLTSNSDSIWHLQSFFLVFGREILRCKEFRKFLSSLWSFPTKELVILFYELRLTALVRSLGYKVEALFDLDGKKFPENNKTIFYPCELYEAGFPFVKGALVGDDKILKRFSSLGCDVRRFL